MEGGTERRTGHIVGQIRVLHAVFTALNQMRVPVASSLASMSPCMRVQAVMAHVRARHAEFLKECPQVRINAFPCFLEGWALLCFYGSQVTALFG